MRRFWKKAPFAVITLVAILCAGGVAFATSDDGATGQTAQEPLGSLSATSPGTDEGTTPGLGSGDEGEVLGAEAGGTAGKAGTGSTGTTGGDGSLPFSGFVAIPLLVAGTALILTGVGLRRRTVRASAA